jgi:hypothetical protein
MRRMVLLTVVVVLILGVAAIPGSGQTERETEVLASTTVLVAGLNLPGLDTSDPETVGDFGAKSHLYLVPLTVRQIRALGAQAG